jgi:hypothetical protein
MTGQSTETSIPAVSTTITEYSTTEVALATLRSKYSDIKFAVSTTQGMEEAKKVRAEIKGYRVALEAKRVEIKAPALKQCQFIDSEAKRITAELEKLEDPIDDQITAEVKRKKEAKELLEKTERDRIASIQKRISDINNLPLQAISKSSAELITFISEVEDIAIDITFTEFQDTAETAKGDALTKLWEMVSAKQANEAEAGQLKLDREKLDRDKEEQERLTAADDVRKNGIRKKIDAIRDVYVTPGMSSSDIEALAVTHKATVLIPEEYQEFYDEALRVHQSLVATLDRTHTEAVDREEKAAQLVTQQAELDRQQKDIDEQNRKQKEQHALDAADALKSAGPLKALSDIYKITDDHLIDDKTARAHIQAIAAVFHANQGELA